MKTAESTVELPFGQTDATVDELRAVIDIEAATAVATKAGIHGAEERILNLIDCLPALLAWLEENGRRYPWRLTTDPWRIYITEILLQRTRGDAVEGVYHEFFDRFPDYRALANSSEDDIGDAVYTLGLVNHRTRSLKEAAMHCSDHGGVPDTLEGLKQPWRVGDYSARACQLFARGEPLALVDANFGRVFGRVLPYDLPRQPHKSDEFYAFLDVLVPAKSGLARAFNLAVLDLGALICTPSNPLCQRCPLKSTCNYYLRTDNTNDASGRQ